MSDGWRGIESAPENEWQDAWKITGDTDWMIGLLGPRDSYGFVRRHLGKWEDDRRNDVTPHLSKVHPLPEKPPADPDE
jgi:hypothetical protein